MGGLLELSLRIKGFDIAKAKRMLFDVQNLNEHDFFKWHIAKRDEIVQFHAKHNKLYREKIEGRSIQDFESLPVMKKSDFQYGISNILSDNYKLNDVHSGSTSGSSGHPLYFVKDRVAHARTHALIIDRYARHGLRVDDKQARFYGIPLMGKGRIIELLKDKLANRIRFPVFDLSDRVLEEFLQRFYREKFIYIYGYSSAIVLFAKYIISNNLVLKEICPTLKFCIVTSELCTQEDQITIERAFGIKMLNEYGASELDVMAFTSPNGEWELSLENVYFEIVDNEDKALPWGSEGRLLVTSLFNKAMPLIRYEIGDVGIISKKRDKLILEKLTGRVNDLVLLPSGKRPAGFTFYYVAKSILERTNVIKEFIIRQVKLDTFIFDVVCDRDITKDEFNLMQKKMDLYLEPGLKLIINRVDQIDRPKSGKIKHFYQMIK